MLAHGLRQAKYLFKTWYPSLGVFGAGGGVLFLYITDWKVINKNIPFYGSKFVEEKEE